MIEPRFALDEFPEQELLGLTLLNNRRR